MYKKQNFSKQPNVNVSGHVTDFPRASRSRVTTQAQDNRMRTQHLRDRKRTAARTARETRGRHGGIVHNGKTQLVTVNGTLNAQRFRDDILTPVVLPFMQAGSGVTILQHDNARPHTTRATTQFLANNVNVMEWPSMSPDLSPIEHIWDELDRCVRARPNQPTNLPQYQPTLLQDWNNLPNNIVCLYMYIRSMRKRCRAVINSNGGHTRY